MAYQKPASSHPWRQYKDRYKDGAEREEKKQPSETVHTFVLGLVENWENIEVTTVYKEEGKFFLIDLPPDKQALWLMGLLKRKYVN